MGTLHMGSAFIISIIMTLVVVRFVVVVFWLDICEMNRRAYNGNNRYRRHRLLDIVDRIIFERFWDLRIWRYGTISEMAIDRLKEELNTKK